MKKQTTIKNKISFTGIGVHCGDRTSVTLCPAPLGTGIVFKNANNLEQSIVVGTVVPEIAMHATVIRHGQWQASTIEHLMAALSMLGVDHVEIIVNGPEIPILDGSSLPFVVGILDTGLVQFDAPRHFITPKKIVTFSDDQGRLIEISPNREGRLILDYNADFVHPLAGSPTFSGEITTEFFIDHIAPARTFGHLEQLPFLRQHGLARGSSLGNTVVIGSELLNDMRMNDECVKHKVLDFLGDISLAGTRVAGTIKACKTGHAFNRHVAANIIEHPEAWDIIVLNS